MKKVVKDCTEEGKKYLAQYADEITHRENDDAEFNYKMGFIDGAIDVHDAENGKGNFIRKIYE